MSDHENAGRDGGATDDRLRGKPLALDGAYDTQVKLISEQLSTFSGDNFQLDDHQLELALDAEMLAIVITPDVLRLVSDLEFRKPADVQVTPPPRLKC